MRERSDGWQGRNWRITEAADAPPIVGLDAPPFIGRLLRLRGIDSATEAMEFLNPEWWTLADPAPLGDWHEAVKRVVQAATSGEPVAVYGDYDVDGITGTAILTEGLREIGIDARPFIPHREREGYGVSDAAVAELAGAGARVLITADCGVTALREIQAARDEHGLDVIVLDHHEPAEELPVATAIVTPKLAPAGHPLGHLSTGGLAYRFAHAITQDAGVDVPPERWLDLAAMSAVADVVPLRGENRWIVHQGLQAIEATKRPGLHALLRSGRGAGGIRVDTETIGFQLAPRLNAAGRLDDAQLALDTLMERDPARAKALADQLEALNQQRRRLTTEAMEAASNEIRRQLDSSGQAPLALFVGGEEIHHGIVGIVAGRLADEWSRPAFVWSIVDGEARVSGRTSAGFDLVQMLDQARDLLIRGGGHQAAAGFSAEPSKLGAIMQRLNQSAEAQLAAGAGGTDALKAFTTVDAQVPLEAVTPSIARWIERLAPFGEGNPAPRFLSTSVSVEQVRTVGADNAHLSLDLRAGERHWSAIGWRLGGAAAEIGRELDLVWSLRRGLRGRRELEVLDLAT